MPYGYGGETVISLRSLFKSFITAACALAAFSSVAHGQSQSGFTYNGLNLTSYQATEYNNSANAASSMRATGANYGAVMVTQYQQTSTANVIAPETTSSPGYMNNYSTTPTDAAVVSAIKSLQAQGFVVSMKPQVDSIDGVFRGSFAPTNPAAWFASYQTFILHYAQIATQNNVGMLVIGTEFVSLSGSAYKSNWETIISALRSQYPNLTLAYAANATYAGDEFTKVSFWADIDVIGVDGYFPLTNTNDPSLAALIAAWSNNQSGYNIVSGLKNLQATYNKPLIFTEIGYVSVSGTNQKPYANITGTYDPTEQQNCYEAFFQVFSAQNAWMKGVFWWDWTVSAPGANDMNYSPQNKAAGNVTLPKWFNSTNPGFTIAPAQSTVSLGQGLSTVDVISVSNQGGFTGAVTLAVSGLPAGVTGAFTAGTATGTQNLTLTASSTAAIAGPVTVTVTGTSGAVTATTSIATSVIAAKAQTITFANPGAQTLGATISLVANSTSGLPITFSSTTPAVCSLNATAATAMMLTVGTCTISASQGGNGIYSAGAVVTDSFQVTALPTVSVPANADVIVSEINFRVNVGGYALSAGNPAGGSLGVSSLGMVALANNQNVELVNATTGALITLGPWSNAAATAVDANNNIYVGNSYGPINSIVKIPYVGGGTNGGYAAFTTPTATTPLCTTAANTECLLPANLGSINVSSMAFDASGNLFFVTAGSGQTSGNGIFECNLTCLAGTGTPVNVYTEATVIPAPSATSGQLLIGSVAIDSAGNLFFTDSSIFVNSSYAYYSFSSNVKELTTSTGAGFGGATTGFSASPLTLYTLNTPNPSAYGNQVNGVVVQRNSAGDTIYFADSFDQIFGFPDSPGGIPVVMGKPTALYTAAVTGGKNLAIDNAGNLYPITYSAATGSGGDTLAQVTLNNVSVPASPAGTATSPSTTLSPITTILNDSTCTSVPAPSVTFTATPNSSATGSVTPSAACSSTFNSNASFATTVSFTPTVAGADSLSFTGKDQLTNSGTVSLNGIGAGFTLTPASTSVTVPQTTSTTDTIMVAAFGGFTGNVTLAASGLPTGVTAAFATNPATSSSVLTFTASSAAAIGGPYNITITGTSGTQTAMTTIAVSVTAAPGFTVSSSVSSISLPQSNSAMSTITVNQLSGFSGSVNLTIAGLPAGVTAAFGTNPTTTTSVLTLTASSTATVGGPVNLTISGVSGATTQTVTIALTVTSAPSYKIAPSATAVAVTQGSTNTDTIMVTASNGFASGVTFTTSGLPAGVTATYSPNPTTSGSSVLTFTASGTAAFGPAVTVTVTGTSGTQTQTTTIQLTVNAQPGFTLAATPAAVTVGQGLTATSTIAVTDQGGYTGTATLTASGLPTGITATFGTNPATSSSVVTFTATSTAPVGTSTVTITGTNGTYSTTTTITLTVSLPPSFTMSAAPTTLTIIQGTSGNSTVTINGANNFNGSVTLAASGLPTGVTAVFATNPATASSVVTFSATATAAAGTSTVTITGTSGTLMATTTVSITIGLAPSFTITPASPNVAIVQGGATVNDALTITGANGFTGMVTLTATGLPSGVTAVFTPNPATGTSSVALSAASTAAVGGPVSVTITGTSGTTVGSTTVMLTVNPPPGFTIVAAPSTVTIAQTTSVTSTITVTSIGGFTGTPTLAATGLPYGITASFAPGTAGTQIVTLTAAKDAGMPAGTTPSYPVSGTITITATSGTLTSSTTLALNIIQAPSFVYSSVPLVVKAGAQVLNSTPVSIVAINGFSGTVALTCAITPAVATNAATCSLAPATVTLAGTVPQTTVLTVTTTGGALVENHWMPFLFSTGTGTVLAFLLFLRLPRRRRNWAAGVLVVVLGVFAVGLSGCGSTPNYSNASVGTPVGNYTVTITGTSGATTASGNVSLVVQ